MSRSILSCKSQWFIIASKQDPVNPFTDAEDGHIRRRVSEYAEMIQRPRWTDIGKPIGRLGEQVRERWSSVLDPSIKCGPWSPEEEEHLLRLVAEISARKMIPWTKIGKG